MDQVATAPFGERAMISKQLAKELAELALSPGEVYQLSLCRDGVEVHCKRFDPGSDYSAVFCWATSHFAEGMSFSLSKAGRVGK